LTLTNSNPVKPIARFFVVHFREASKRGCALCPSRLRLLRAPRDERIVGLQV
jgi:hypothetical protein